MRHYVFIDHGAICDICGNYIQNKFVVISDDCSHKCKTEDTIEIKCSENKTRKLPDCENCYKTTKDKFLECVSKLRVLHLGCYLNTLDK